MPRASSRSSARPSERCSIASSTSGAVGVPSAFAAARRSVISDTISRCWAPSWRSRSSRRRAASPASTIRRRDSSSASARACSASSRRRRSSASWRAVTSSAAPCNPDRAVVGDELPQPAQDPGVGAVGAQRAVLDLGDRAVGRGTANRGRHALSILRMHEVGPDDARLRAHEVRRGIAGDRAHLVADELDQVRLGRDPGAEDQPGNGPEDRIELRSAVGRHEAPIVLRRHGRLALNTHAGVASDGVIRLA